MMRVVVTSWICTMARTPPSVERGIGEPDTITHSGAPWQEDWRVSRQNSLMRPASRALKRSLRRAPSTTSASAQNGRCCQ